MRQPLFLALLTLVFSVAAAGVYRSIGPDGTIQYTDRPISGADQVRLPHTGHEPAESAEKTSAPDHADTGPYESFEIALPEPNATIRSEKGEVKVSLILAPALIAGHSIRFSIDGFLLPGEVPGTQATLNDVTLGTHSLQGQIFDELDVPVAYTPSVTFHMRKPLPDSMLPE